MGIAPSIGGRGPQVAEADPLTLSTPAAGSSNTYVDSGDHLWKTKDATGVVHNSYLANSSTASQAPAAATRTIIAGSTITLPRAGAVQVGTVFRWRFNMTKTAAGIAASTFDIAIGTAGTTADTAQVSFTKPAGTAAVDEAFVEVEAVVRAVGASCVISAEFTLIHNGNTVGHATIPCVVVNGVSAAFNISTATKISLAITSGAADAITIQQVTAEAFNVA